MTGPPTLSGEPLNTRPSRAAREVRLSATPRGDLIVAWTDDTRTLGHKVGPGVFVKRWDGRS